MSPERWDGKAILEFSKEILVYVKLWIVSPNEMHLNVFQQKTFLLSFIFSLTHNKNNRLSQFFRFISFIAMTTGTNPHSSLKLFVWKGFSQWHISVILDSLRENMNYSSFCCLWKDIVVRGKRKSFEFEYDSSKINNTASCVFCANSRLPPHTIPRKR